MSQIDPDDRTELTGLWAGFGFQRGHMYIPEGHSLEPADMRWWSLTCNTAREWRLMMAEARPAQCTSSNEQSKALPCKGRRVIHLRDAIQSRRQKKLAKVMAGADAAASNVVPLRRGPNPRKRG